MSALLPVYPRLELELVGAEGCWLHTADGRRILDLYGGHAVCPLGHGHPELAETLAAAYRGLDFYSNSLHMAVQERAARAVLAGSAHLSHVHFVNSGTEANESALHLMRRLTGRETVVTLTTGFHGRTLASLAATGLAAYHTRLSVRVPGHWQRFLALNDHAAIDDVITSDVAGVLIESVPSLGGIRMPETAWLRAVQDRAHAVGAFFALDEVQGGVGRLGTWHGHDTLGVTPDLVTLAKSLGGGFPVGALLTTPDIAARVTHSELGTTFGGGPMAAAMIEAVARVVHRDDLLSRVRAIFARVKDGLAGVPGVEVRGAGCLIGVATPLKATALRDRLLAADVMVGTSGDPHTLRLLPPYVLQDAHVDAFVGLVREVLGG